MTAGLAHPPALNDTAPSGPRRPDRAGLARTATLAALVVGAALRIVQYAGNRSLWLDEALVAENVLGRGWLRLLAPLHADQVAPPGFLFVEKAATLVFGGAEWVLRAPVLLCGVAALLLFPRMAGRWLGPRGVAWGTALMAVYPYLIYFASELKPYSGDVLAAVLLLWLAPVADAHGRRPSAGQFAAVGAAAVWFSYPAVFLLAGIALAALLERRREGLRPLARTALPHLGWAASFAAVYLLTRGGADAGYVKAWWQAGFAPLPSSAEALAWYPRTLLRLFRDPLGRYDTGAAAAQVVQPAAAMLGAALGLAVLVRARSRLALIALSVALALLAASALRLFPLGAEREGAGRVLLFVAPLAALLVAAGLERLSRTELVSPRVAGALLGALIALPLARGTLSMVPHGRVELRPLVEYVARHRRPGDVIYVFYQAAPVFRYYAPRTGIRPGDWVQGTCARLDPARYVADVDRFRGRPRVWMLMTQPGTGAHDFPERALILRHVGGMGAVQDRLFGTGGALYLFDFTAPPMTAEVRDEVPRLPQEPENGCVGPWASPSTP